MTLHKIVTPGDLTPLPSGMFLMTPESLLDAVSDVIGLLETTFPNHEVGLPRAYFEYVTGSEDETLSMHRFVYESFCYQIDNPPTEQELISLRDMMYADVVSLAVKSGAEPMLVWRLSEKIAVSESLCRKCGGSFSIRSRIAFIPKEVADRGRLRKDSDT